MQTFRDFMESALYDPERGYYSTRTQTADFYTAPELHSAFGEILADRLAALLRRARTARPSAPLALVEGGCGDGTLAAQIARRLGERHADIASALRFILIERSRKDLTTAARRMSEFGRPVDALTSIERLPSFSGVLYSNELFDAMPAHLLQKRSGRVLEVHVDDEGRQVLAPASSPRVEEIAAEIAPALAEGERHAVSLAAPLWLSQAAARLEKGFLVTVDYGKRFSRETPNAPRAYRAHRLESDLTACPGAQDLTVPADFSALAAAGERVGAAMESYQTLSGFLIEGGIEAWFTPGPDSFAERTRLKTLVHPEGMGEAFKVMIQRKNMEAAS